MSFQVPALIAGLFLVYALASRKLADSSWTGPMLFTAFGLVIGPQMLGWLELEISNHLIQALAELTLVVVLFTDAAAADFGALTRARSLPTRMLPIALSLVGQGLGREQIAFLGWFGPRGLASVLFVLLIVEGTNLARRHELLAAVVLTVGFSIVAHGVSAAPWARRLGRLGRSGRLGQSALPGRNES